MLLICGSPEDRLVQELLQQSREKALVETEQLEESELFGGCSFSFERSVERKCGFINIHGRRVDFMDLQGVILRLRRMWWPSDEFDLQDQMFVYHETMASWFALLDSLDCPVVNRLGLGWWLQDAGYSLELRARLAEVLRLPVSTAGEPQLVDGYVSPTEQIIGDAADSIYYAGGCFLPAPGCGPDLVACVAEKANAFSKWDRETGVIFSRLVFERRNGVYLKAVEPFPVLENEQDELVREIASAILERIAHSKG